MFTFCESAAIPRTLASLLDGVRRGFLSVYLLRISPCPLTLAVLHPQELLRDPRVHASTPLAQGGASSRVGVILTADSSSARGGLWPLWGCLAAAACLQCVGYCAELCVATGKYRRYVPCPGQYVRGVSVSTWCEGCTVASKALFSCSW